MLYQRLIVQDLESQLVSVKHVRTSHYHFYSVRVLYLRKTRMKESFPLSPGWGGRLLHQILSCESLQCAPYRGRAQNARIFADSPFKSILLAVCSLTAAWGQQFAFELLFQAPRPLWGKCEKSGFCPRWAEWLWLESICHTSVKSNERTKKPVHRRRWLFMLLWDRKPIGLMNCVGFHGLNWLPELC